MSNTTTFVPSGTPISFTTEAPGPQTLAMPAVDSGNLDLLVLNQGAGPVYIAWAPGVPLAGDCLGAFIAQPGTPILLTANALTLAASAGNPRVRNSGGLFGTATEFTYLAMMAGGQVTIQRGTATAETTFQS
jgi:hypothetical protein